VAEHERNDHADRRGTFVLNGHGFIRLRSRARPAPSDGTGGGKMPNAGVVRANVNLLGRRIGPSNPTGAGESGL
jgi:hypothetical protein